MMILSKDQPESMKNVELEIFQSFIKVCDKLGLKYYIISTLLGAVRHKGFIPWDDYIDVGMPRADYDIFVSEAQKHLPENLFVQTHITDNGYLRPFAKIRNSNTAFIETAVGHINMKH